MHRALWSFVLVGCWTGQPSPESPGSGSTVEPAKPRADRRCLPLVTSECGCVYSCGVGIATGDHWTVRHAFWKDTELKAKTTRWCVDGACTDAFDVEIVCDGICPRRPADPTCRFVGDACVSASEISPR